MKKTIYTLAIAMLIIIFLYPAKSWAQRITEEDVKAQLIKDWERAKAYTVEYLNKMPANKYSFKAVDSLRSFAQQMLHLATGNIFLMSKAGELPAPSYGKSDLEHSASAQNKDSVMYYVTNSYDYCLNSVKSLDLNKWGEKLTLFGMEETRFALIMKTFEHQTHHRGQTTTYIRLTNTIPPGEKLFP